MKCNQVEINWVGRTSIRYTQLTQASLLFKIPASLFFPPHPPNPSLNLSSSVPNRLSPFSPTNAVRDLSETYNVKYRKYHQSRKNIANISPIGESSACQPSLDFPSPRTSIRSFVTPPPHLPFSTIGVLPSTFQPHAILVPVPFRTFSSSPTSTTSTHLRPQEQPSLFAPSTHSHSHTPSSWP